MRTITLCTTLALATFVALSATAASPPQAAAAEKTYISFKTYTQEEDDRILRLYEPLRVADVSDGMDIVGLQDVGLMEPAMKALWKNTEDFSHRFVGIAVTARYVPTNRRAGRMPVEEYKKWEGWWYNQLSPEPFVSLLRRGSVIVIDGTQDGDTGTIGSNNILVWKLRGAVGVITTGGARDTDEIIKQKVPVYLKQVGRGIRPGRNEIESVNKPITCAGVLVRPGDVVVADGDGVIVVPREHAEEVAKAAMVILEGDKASRRKLYEKLGMPVDKTVLPD